MEGVVEGVVDGVVEGAVEMKSRVKTLGKFRMLFPAVTILFILFIYLTHFFFHCVPFFYEYSTSTGMLHFLTVLVPTSLLLVSLVRAMVTCPGRVPDTREWRYNEKRASTMIKGERLEMRHTIVESKVEGGQRNCRKCLKYKPDRTHHCRVCKTCVLRMDHHCTWVYNCIGQHNHKYFFLMLFYAFVSLQAVAWTMWSTFMAVLNDVHSAYDFTEAVLLLFIEVFSIGGSIVFLVFWIFHAVLLVRGLSTIEQSEKQGISGYSIWNLGTRRNIESVLGTKPALWLLPTTPDIPSGLEFEHRLKSD